MNDAGLIVITAFISPYRQDRRNAKKIIGEGFREVYVSTSIAECEKRDVKGLYKAAREGKIAHFTGITSPYEVPAFVFLLLMFPIIRDGFFFARPRTTALSKAMESIPCTIRI